jgi:hypothetical protein
MATLKNTIINDTGFLTVPTGNTAARPGSPVNGQVRYNTDSQILENYANSAWVTPVVTSGLVMYLDPGNKASYAGFGTTLRDLTGNGKNGLLINSPTYSATSGGVFQFNGTNNYISVSTLNLASGTYTVMGAARYTGATRGRIITSLTNNWLLGNWSSSTQNYYAAGWVTPAAATGPNDTTWRIYAGTGNTAGASYAFYVNAALNTGPTTGGSAGPNGLSLGAYNGSSEWTTGEVGFVLAYNRVLTAAEIYQNYNAFRSRYSL